VRTERRFLNLSIPELSSAAFERLIAPLWRRSTPEKPSERRQAAIEGPKTRGRERCPVDQGIGLHLEKVLFGETLSESAANPKHLAKMTEAAEVVGTIERFPARLGAVTAFKPRRAFELYEYLFPNPDEREPTKDILARLKDYRTGAKSNGAGFFSIGISDKEGDVIAYTQGSTVPSEKGLFFYWQYGGVADRRFMQERYDKDTNPRERGVLNIIQGVNTALLKATAKKVGRPALGTIWESEPKGLGANAEDIRFTARRLAIHNRTGGRVMMGVARDGRLINLHLQPRLTPESEPIALHMMFRPLSFEEGSEEKTSEMTKADVASMLKGWIDNFRLEGFREKDVAEAEQEIERRLAASEKIVLLPASELPDVVTLAKDDPILKKQILQMYEVHDLDEARAFYDRAMAASSAE
jgi:hypothetical protein